MMDTNSSASTTIWSGTGSTRDTTSRRIVMRLVAKQHILNGIEFYLTYTLLNRSLRIPRIRIDFVNAMPDHSDVWPSGQIVHNDAKFLFRPPIVSIEECNKLALRLRNARIERGCLAAICFLNQTYIRLKFADDFGRAVSRPIVHHEDLRLCSREILFQGAYDGVFDKTLVIVQIG